MKRLSLLVCILMLTACQPKSEIDKCTEAIVKMNEPYKNDPERNEMEARSRIKCLQAQSGKE
jgi:hypothetical protein